MTATVAPECEAPSTFDVRSPVDGRVIQTLPVFTPDEVARSAAALRAAQPEWEELGPAGRCAHLRDWLDWTMDNERRLVELVQAESGKSWGDAAFEPGFAVEVVNYVTRNAADWLAATRVKPHSVLNATKRLKLFLRPHQLVGVIMPWNVPLGMPFLDIPYALAAGAAVLSKPSEMTPLSWREVVRAWREEIGAPAVLDCVTGLSATGAAVVDMVDMVQFTGSVATGRRIAARAGERLIPCSLELGGKDAMIVLEDADIDRAVGGAVTGGLFNAGQGCICIERVYVHERVYDKFVAKLTDKVSRLRMGSETDGSFCNDMGALVTQNQIDIVERHVADALAKGAIVLTGGTRGPSNSYYTPTVLVDVDHTMDCMREETFGPTLPIMKVRDEDEAIALANDSEYGLSGSVWTNDAARAERVARQLETGGVCANNVLQSGFQLQLPFGGWKNSGIGSRGGGASGIRKFCRQQSYIAERVTLKSELNWYPHTPAKGRAMARLIRLFGMHDWRRRLGLPPKR